MTDLLAWYARAARDLPWRVGPADRAAGGRPDPYAVWLSEVMLQQTTAPHAAPYFLRFLARWPNVEALAAAPFSEVAREWAGLGYYARARNLHACAQAIAAAGRFPHDRAGWRALPGVGPYTSAAIAALAFGEQVAPVDGNIERVVTRLEAISGDGGAADWRRAKAAVDAWVQAAVPADRPAEFAEALMDLGAGVCTPRAPDCGACPLSRHCRARAEGQPERYPPKPRRGDTPLRRGFALVWLDGGQVWLERRPPRGLLGGMLMPPCSDWTEQPPAAPPPAWITGDCAHAGQVRHVFTHFRLELEVHVRSGPGDAAALTPGAAGEWMAVEDALGALPTVGRKALRLALAQRA